MMCGNFGRDEGDCERCGRTVDSCSIKAKIKQLEDIKDCASNRIRDLEAALIHISETCIQDPDTAQFALRFVDGSASLEKRNGEIKRLTALLHAFSICPKCGGSWGEDCPECNPNKTIRKLAMDKEIKNV